VGNRWFLHRAVRFMPAQASGSSSTSAPLDLSEPVGLLLIAVLHFIRDDDRPRDILGTLVDALAPGSYIAASHATPEYMPPEQAAALRAVMESQWADRPGTDLAALFEHPRLEQVAPGVQSVFRWWAENAPDPRPTVEDVASNGIVLRVTG
jgi:S-adenosyl methyltransferase